MIICIVNFQAFGMCRNNNQKKRSKTTTTTFKLIDRDARGEIAVQLPLASQEKSEDFSMLCPQLFKACIKTMPKVPKVANEWN